MAEESWLFQTVVQKNNERVIVWATKPTTLILFSTLRNTNRSIYLGEWSNQCGLSLWMYVAVTITVPCSHYADFEGSGKIKGGGLRGSSPPPKSSTPQEPTVENSKVKNRFLI